MSWFYRLLLGFPPRKGGQDIKQFKETFPEISDSESFENSFWRKRLPFPFLNKVDKKWFSGDKECSEKSSFRCEIPGCNFVAKNGVIDRHQDSKSALNLILGPLGHINGNSNIGDFVKAIEKVLIDAQNNFKGSNSKSLGRIDEAYYIDRYMGKFFLNNEENGKSFIKKLKEIFQNIKFVSSNKDIKDKKKKFCDDWIVLEDEKFPFHDRFIVCKSGKKMFGILVGSSGQSFNGNKHFMIAKLPKNDVPVWWKILEHHKIIKTTPKKTGRLSDQSSQ